MSETNSVLPSAQPDSPVGVKFSDLNAVKQQILTRAAVTLTGIGLTAVAAGAIGQLVPHISDIAPDAYPVLVYIAAVVLPLAGFVATTTLRLSPELQIAIFERISSEAGHPDAVSPELQRLFVRDVRFDSGRLNFARHALTWGVFLLLAHAYFITLIKSGYLNPADAVRLLRSLGHGNLSEGAASYYGLTIGSIIFITFIEVPQWLIERRRRRRANASKLKNSAWGAFKRRPSEITTRNLPLHGEGFHQQNPE